MPRQHTTEVVGCSNATLEPMAAPVRQRIHKRMLAYDGVAVHTDIDFTETPITTSGSSTRYLATTNQRWAPVHSIRALPITGCYRRRGSPPTNVVIMILGNRRRSWDRRSGSKEPVTCRVDILYIRLMVTFIACSARYTVFRGAMQKWTVDGYL